MNAAFAAASPLLAFHVREQPTVATSTPIAARQQFEKTFTVVSGDTTTTTNDKLPLLPIERLVLSAPGVTFVSFDASVVSPTVKVSTEQREVVDLFEVVIATDGLEVRTSAPLHGRHYVLTEVSLPIAYALRSLELQSSTTVVVEDKVLTAHDPHADVSIRVRGSGTVLAASQSGLLLRSLTLELLGSGDCQLVAPSVSARDTVSAAIHSSGDARMFTGSLNAPVVKLSMLGSGDLQLAALSIEALEELTVAVSGSGEVKTIGEAIKAASVKMSVSGSGEIALVTQVELHAQSVRAAVSGSGEIHVASGNAHCRDATISIAGSGDVDARDLSAQRIKVRISGSGDALVRATEEADVSASGSGTITLVGERPTRVSGRASHAADKPSQLARLSLKRRPQLPTPTRADAFEQLSQWDENTALRSTLGDFLRGIKSLFTQRDSVGGRPAAGTPAP